MSHAHFALYKMMLLRHFCEFEHYIEQTEPFVFGIQVVNGYFPTGFWRSLKIVLIYMAFYQIVTHHFFLRTDKNKRVICRNRPEICFGWFKVSRVMSTNHRQIIAAEAVFIYADNKLIFVPIICYRMHEPKAILFIAFWVFEAVKLIDFFEFKVHFFF